MPSSASASRRLLRTFAGEPLWPPPIWLMRQAGRYLPEYRATRTKAGSFLQLCYTPELAAEVTLQPIRRYEFDAAILFADILLVPDALGQRLEFVEGEGPQLEPIRSAAELVRLRPDATRPKYDRVCETVARLRQDLPNDTTLIGFCGAPWTVATYMVEGRGSPDQAQARLWAYRDPVGFQALIDLLTDSSIDYLSRQVDAGADVLQIFDTWAGSLPDGEFAKWVLAPTKRLVEGVRARHPDVPIIGFPRGAGGHIDIYGAATGVQAIGFDTAAPASEMARMAATAGLVAQGNLDPLRLVVGGEAMAAGVREILAAMQGARFIFNLGHGIRQETPPENVGRLVQLVREAV